MVRWTLLTLALSVGCGNKYIYNGGDDSGGDGGDSAGDGGSGGGDQDLDADGFTVDDGDCNDSDATIYPGAEDTCGDLIDRDCDDDPECDCDGDGADGEQCAGDDCDDDDAARYPLAEDACDDGVDSDCDGATEYDCDGDGYQSEDGGGDDCDDDDPGVNPGVPEDCGDDDDEDCDPDTVPCDCDGDGSQDAACGGDDCDDADPDVYAGASEAAADGMDNDCDGEVDEDAYCHLLMPMSNGSAATKTYDTLAWDGNRYTELAYVLSWDDSTGRGTIFRDFTGSSGDMQVTQEVACDETGGWALGVEIVSGGTAIAAVSYSEPRPDLVPFDELTEGMSWPYAYDGEDGTWGTLYEARGTFTVGAPETVTTTAGTFDAVVIVNDYEIIDPSFGLLDRQGRATVYYVERLGIVKVEDLAPDGSVQESRELTAYTGYYLE
jgi:hypothetical protein